MPAPPRLSGHACEADARSRSSAATFANPPIPRSLANAHPDAHQVASPEPRPPGPRLPGHGPWPRSPGCACPATFPRPLLPGSSPAQRRQPGGACAPTSAWQRVCTAALARPAGLCGHVCAPRFARQLLPRLPGCACPAAPARPCLHGCVCPGRTPPGTFARLATPCGCACAAAPAWSRLLGRVHPSATPYAPSARLLLLVHARLATHTRSRLTAYGRLLVFASRSVC